MPVVRTNNVQINAGPVIIRSQWSDGHSRGELGPLMRFLSDESDYKRVSLDHLANLSAPSPPPPAATDNSQQVAVYNENVYRGGSKWRQLNLAGWAALYTTATYYGCTDALTWPNPREVQQHTWRYIRKLDKQEKELASLIKALEVPDAPDAVICKVQYIRENLNGTIASRLFISLTGEQRSGFSVPVLFSHQTTSSIGPPAHIPIIAQRQMGTYQEDLLAGLPTTFAQRGRRRFALDGARFFEPICHTDMLRESKVTANRFLLFTATTSYSRTNLFPGFGRPSRAFLPPQWQGDEPPAGRRFLGMDEQEAPRARPGADDTNASFFAPDVDASVQEGKRAMDRLSEPLARVFAGNTVEVTHLARLHSESLATVVAALSESSQRPSNSATMTARRKLAHEVLRGNSGESATQIYRRRQQLVHPDRTMQLADPLRETAKQVSQLLNCAMDVCSTAA